MPSGYTSDLPNDTLLDVAVLSRKIDTQQVPFGVSRGGLTFSPRKEMRNVEFDGKRSPIAGLDRITSHSAEISGTFIQFGTSQLADLEPASTATQTGTSTKITPHDASTLIPAGALITALTLTYQRLGGGTASVVFPLAICREYSLQGQDNSEAEVKAAFEARLDLSGPDASTDSPPYHIVVVDPAVTP